MSKKPPAKVNPASKGSTPKQAKAKAETEASSESPAAKIPAGYKPPRLKPGTVERLVEYFNQVMPAPETELAYTNPYELIVAVVLSAQCTDVRVNQVTPGLFRAFPTVQDLALATPEMVFPHIRSVSYPNNKSKHLVALAQRIVSVYNGEVPADPDELETLQGVGRKTANVLSSVLHNAARIAVDTHVFRVSNRIGLAKAKNVRQTEEQLMRQLPGNELPRFHHWLILHGRYTCKARTPLCAQCGLTDVCNWYVLSAKTKLKTLTKGKAADQTVKRKSTNPTKAQPKRAPKV
jgi:endonuclease-3